MLSRELQVSAAPANAQWYAAQRDVMRIRRKPLCNVHQNSPLLGGCINGANWRRCPLTHQPPSTANVAHPSFARERPHHDMLLLQPAGVSLVLDRIQYRCNPLLVDMHAALTPTALQLSVASSFCRFRCSNLYTLPSMRREQLRRPSYSDSRGDGTRMVDFGDLEQARLLDRIRPKDGRL
jgi:hypothetical protein